MRKYGENASSQVRIQYGYELEASLSQEPQLASTASIVRSQTAALESAYEARVKAERAMVQPKVQVRFADWRVDGTVRLVAKTAELADGGKRGPISRGLLPDGMSPLVAPVGTAQLQTTKDFVLRAKACTVPGAEKVCAETLPRVEEAMGQLETAMKARQAAEAVYVSARAAEVAAQQDHELMIEKVMGLVRSTFPKERARWDLIFPSVRGARTVEVEETAEATAAE